MSCKNDCEKEVVFPIDIFNRPALHTVSYRIGQYSNIREHMLDALNQDEALQAWTHRGADDPGIAILECNAVIGDILTFYQQLYANEAFMRTSKWRESISDLVKISGYRLSPGVAGEATFALKVKGEKSVSVSKGFGFKAQLEDREQQDEFESQQEVIAYPQLSEFNLYRPAKGMQSINKDSNQLELYKVDGANDLSSLQSVDIKAGDHIMLTPDSSMFDDDNEPYVGQDKPEILIVESVETILNRIIITFEGALTINRGSTIRAYVINRTFRHFGYNVAKKFSYYDGEVVTINVTDFERKINTTDSGGDFYSSLKREELPLDQEVNDLAAGAKIICQGLATEFEDNTESPRVKYTDKSFVVVRQIEEIYVNNIQWGNTERATTIVKISEKILNNIDIYYEKMDIRQCRFHEVSSPEITLRSVTESDNGSFSSNILEYYGCYNDAKSFVERRLMLVDAENETIQSVTTTNVLSDFETQLASRDEENLWLWSIALDQYPEFNHEDFDQAEPIIKIYGNLVDADQGKTQDEVVLGNGDNRQAFQTFALPKTPLTYLLDEAQIPELDVYVDSILWSRVDSFFNSGPDEQVYVVREDNNQTSYIQFGDGVNGIRLPSGIKNITAIYRVGVGAAGNPETDSSPSATGKLKQLEKVYLHTEVTGGGEEETIDNAREAAPAKMQSLGRLVGIADFEAEAKTIPGVLKVNAGWSASDGVPALRIVVLTESGSSAAVEKVQKTISSYNQCRGPSRFPIQTIQGNLQYIYLNVRVGYDSTRKHNDISRAIKSALGLIGEEGNGIETEEGLFSLKKRAFGQTAHVSQIIGHIQQVDGVTWVEIDDAQALDLGSPLEIEPENITKPVIVSSYRNIACLNTRILTLHSVHFDLSLSIDGITKECE